VEIVRPQTLSASRAFLLNLDGLLDACRAEDMAANCCGGLLQLVPTHRTVKNRFLCLRRLIASLQAGPFSPFWREAVYNRCNPLTFVPCVLSSQNTLDLIHDYCCDIGQIIKL
jgi:hypothetical protein